jgi:hypothetical protein
MTVAATSVLFQLLAGGQTGQGPAGPSGASNRAAPAPTAPASTTPRKGPKRIFWIIPNYRTYPDPLHYQPLTAREKFKLAEQDAFDPGTFLLAAGFGGLGQITKSNPSFGQGVKGYAHYFATSYADYAIGDFMTGAIFPTLLHQDPRYFRKGTGSATSRLAHAVTQIFWTRTDSGGHMFNFSEVAGNATAAAIGNAYYPDSRTAADNATRWATQIGVDMVGNVMKEFWPDLYRKLKGKDQP